MPSLYTISIPPIIRGLQNLDAILTIAANHADSQNISADTYTTSRLHPTMNDLSFQIHLARTITNYFLPYTSPHLTLPTHPALHPNMDTSTTFANLQCSLQETISFLQTIKPSDFPSSENENEEFTTPTSPTSPDTEWVWKNKSEFFLMCIMPNFWFHVVSAYNILRMEGVPVGKMDFLNGAGLGVVRKREGM